MADVIVLFADARFTVDFVEAFRRDVKAFGIEIAKGADDLLGRLDFAPRLILVDPGFESNDVDGLGLLRELRARGYRETVFAISRDRSADALLAALLAGADGVLDGERLVHRRCKEIARLLETDPAAIDPFDAYLRSRGLRPSQREFLRDYVAAGFPEHKLQPTSDGATENAVQKRLSRIRIALGLENASQLVSLMTVLSGYVARAKSSVDKDA